MTTKRNYYTLNEAKYADGVYFRFYRDDKLMYEGYRFTRWGAHVGARLQIFLHKLHLDMYYIERRRKAREQRDAGRIYVR